MSIWSSETLKIRLPEKGLISHIKNLEWRMRRMSCPSVGALLRLMRKRRTSACRLNLSFHLDSSGC